MLTPPFTRVRAPLFPGDALNDDEDANRLILTASQSPSESSRTRALATLGYAGIEPEGRERWVAPVVSEPLFAGAGL